MLLFSSARRAGGGGGGGRNGGSIPGRGLFVFVHQLGSSLLGRGGTIGGAASSDGRGTGAARSFTV
jgi:hypothetical protein